MGDWLPGVTVIPIPGHSGIPYVPWEPRWRLVLHTTEGAGTIETQVGGYARTGWYPHVTGDPRDGRVVQHVPFSMAVTTAKNAPGGVETNRLHAIQVELIGYTADMAFWSDEWCDWLGREIIAPILQARPIRLVGPPRPWVDARDGFVARPDAPQRMTAIEWTFFDGVCGHQHLPENDHYDPGRLREDRVFAAARAILDPDEEPEMPQPTTFIVTRDRVGGGPNVGRWITDLLTRRKLKGQADEDHMVVLGAARSPSGAPIPLPPDVFDAIPEAG